MSIILIIVGFFIARFGAGLFIVDEARGGQNTAKGIVTLLIQLLGWGLVVFGAIRLFS